MARRFTDEQGAVLVHVAIAIVALLGLSALAIDTGAKWVARGQAQNAADAGALAGAVALSFDDPGDFSDTGLAKQSAHNYAVANLVWGQPPDNQVATDVTFPPCPDGGSDTCIKVDVYRNQARQNAMDTYFARLFNVFTQGVRATATAQVRVSTATDCLKPWAVVDRWDEYNSAHAEPNYPNPDPDWTPASTYDKYSTNPKIPPEPDLYVPPTATSPGTGWTLPADFGRQFAIKTGAPGNAAVSSGWFRSVDLPRTDMANLGGSAYGENIVSCNRYPVGIAATDTVCPSGSAISTFQEKVAWAAKGCLRVETGVIQGQTKAGIDELYQRDPTARWSSTLDNGHGGVSGSIYAQSPRVVPIAVMDINQYLAGDPSGSGTSVKVVNILGFFIEGMGSLDANGNVIFDPSNPFPGNAKAVVGRLMTIPGVPTAGGAISENAAFLRTIVLVR